MNKTQRAQVVELLRCGADQRGRASEMLYRATVDFGDVDADVTLNAYWAASSLQLEIGKTQDEERRLLLEAAARVENEEWP